MVNSIRYSGTFVDGNLISVASGNTVNTESGWTAPVTWRLDTRLLSHEQIQPAEAEANYHPATHASQTAVMAGLLKPNSLRGTRDGSPAASEGSR